MTKKNANKKKTSTALVKYNKPKNPPKTGFGPVSTISSAPVSIGNTIRSTPPKIVQLRNGSRVIGRDFSFSAGSTVAAVTNWQLIGGVPLTPSVLVSSIMKNFTQMYQKFKINYLCFHYITSSPTTQAGDVMFYYNRDRLNPMIDYTNNGFLALVLSDTTSIIGPQWINHSMLLSPKDEWNSTSYALSADINDETSGELFLFSKTSSANSPGYILMDYDITFSELCVNPRAGILPIARGVYSYITVGRTALAATAGTTNFSTTVQGTNIDGTASALPTGAVTGDIYKFIFAVTASTVSGVNAAWTNTTTANLMVYQSGAWGTTTITIDDGFTTYLTFVGGTTVVLYPTLENAITQTNSYQYGVTATITYNLCGLISLARQVTSGTQSSY